MIKFNYKLNSNTIIDIKNNFIKGHMLVKSDSVLKLCAWESPEWFDELKNLLNYENLVRMVFSKAENLPLINEKVILGLPVLQERYYPEKFFKKLYIDDFYVTLKIGSQKNKNLITAYKNEMIIELARFKKSERSYCIDYFISQLFQAQTPSAIKKVLCAIKGLQKGFSKKINKILISKFPAWVNEFQDIFNYDLFSSKYGYDIVEASRLLVCPFCNEEKIKIIRGAVKKYRPALDHFYAKSKYPYLAVTLSNLIPIGGRCNTAFKSDIDMSGGFMNPLISGMNDLPVFNFTYNAIKNTVNLSILENDEFILNQLLFELNSVYVNKEYKDKYLEFRFLYNYNKGLGISPPFYENPELMNATFNISADKNYYTWPAKKFEMDALEDIFKD